MKTTDAQGAQRPTHIRSARRAVCAGALALLAAAAPAMAAPAARIADPGHFTARTTACPAASDACGGDFEFDGQIFGFAGGRLTGTVAANGDVSNARLTTGTAATDPAVDGPLQLTFTAVGAGAGRGAFAIGDAPGGAAAADGLVFGFEQPLYIRVGGPAVGSTCTIGSPAQPLEATFLATLAGFFGPSDAGAAYDQQDGTTSVTAVLHEIPGAEGCGGEEATIDQELGLPGPGQIALNLSFQPAPQTNLYRAAAR
jgi:hypothetical protein